ncbi:hypothetical protein MKW98_009101 [Papaver atlanticum]|uniref:Uncharacterized protein n=1 Tax=Papaver atlanticum TaxID=357466 RepID=A0AAD4XT73_9MAGN|nr:hypothetical protein MKW98_009101 [Papaver atlanticum]
MLARSAFKYEKLVKVELMDQRQAMEKTCLGLFLPGEATRGQRVLVILQSELEFTSNSFAYESLTLENPQNSGDFAFIIWNSKSTVLMLVNQMINRVEFVHAKSFLHQNMKSR